MDLGATRYFASSIHEFAQSIGKENFYLIGEITGGRRGRYDTLEVTGLDAALGIEDIPDKLEYLVKGGATRRSISGCSGTRSWCTRTRMCGSGTRW